MTTDGVLDTSAILALVKREPGADLVAGLLPQAAVSTVNLSEAMAKLVDRDPGRPRLAWEALRRLGLSVIVDFDSDLARRAGALRAATRKQGLSYADRACLALAGRAGLPAITADRRWADLDIGIAVRLLR